MKNLFGKICDRYIFGMDGDRKLGLDELEDGASYVVSSFKTFKVRVCECVRARVRDQMRCTCFASSVGTPQSRAKPRNFPVEWSR